MYLKKYFIFFIFSIFSLAVLAEENCPFCNEEIIKNQSVYRDKKAYILYNHKPAVPGHVMVIPNRHIESIIELNDEELIEIRNLTKKSAIAINKIYNIENYMVIQKNGSKSGRSIEHIHFHILPIESDYKHPIVRIFDLQEKRTKLSTKEYFLERKKFLEFFAINNNIE